jgi:hypothetical protein
MSTPISDLPNDVDDMDEMDDLPFVSRRKSKMGFIKKYKDLFYVFVAVILASYISLETFRYSVPQQVFTFGDAPIYAAITVAILVVIRLIGKNI